MSIPTREEASGQNERLRADLAAVAAERDRWKKNFGVSEEELALVRGLRDRLGEMVEALAAGGEHLVVVHDWRRARMYEDVRGIKRSTESCPDPALVRGASDADAALRTEIDRLREAARREDRCYAAFVDSDPMVRLQAEIERLRAALVAAAEHHLDEAKSRRGSAHYHAERARVLRSAAEGKP